MQKYLLIFMGGGAGSLLRFFISRYFNPLFISLPIGTLLANVLSSFLLGITLALLQEKFEGNVWLQPFVITGICGGFSTFSTFSSETFDLMKSDNYHWALLNILLNVVLCIIFIAVGMKIIKA
jgi:CrcB protein